MASPGAGLRQAEAKAIASSVDEAGSNQSRGDATMSEVPGGDLVFTPPEQLDAVNHLRAKPFGLEGASLHLYRQDTPLGQPTDPAPLEDTFMAVMHRRSFGAHKEWRNGQRYEVAAARAGSFRFYDLRQSNIADIPFAFHTAHVLLPAAVFRRVAGRRDSGSPTWMFDFDRVIVDPVFRDLMRALLPSIEQPGRSGQLFVEHVLSAIARHVAVSYGPSPVREAPAGRRLAKWQERVAKELLESRLSGDISAAEVAAACGLSPDSFARLFRQTTGLPPHRWVSQLRMDRAKELLRNSTESLSEIALSCGFANQTHFTHAFSASVGSSPGEWRRLTRA
jgi:AraC-like DNA-binding protein